MSKHVRDHCCGSWCVCVCECECACPFQLYAHTLSATINIITQYSVADPLLSFSGLVTHALTTSLGNETDNQPRLKQTINLE